MFHSLHYIYFVTLAVTLLVLPIVSDNFIPEINAETDSVFIRFYDSGINDVKVYKDMSINDSNVLCLFNKSCGCDSNKKSVFYLHGYCDSAHGIMSTTIASALISKGEYNVYLIDWSKLNLPPYYMAVENMKKVGESMATVLNMAINCGLLKYSNINLIGHSLGAHCAGYIGRNLHELPFIIIALDPASPLFQNDMFAKKVTHSDADFVHYIHTDKLMFGTNYDLGIANYNFNNPTIGQPGCLDSVCSHLRAGYYFAEAVNHPKCFIAIRCDSYEQFENCSCAHNYSYIGLPLDEKAEGSYYLTTNPFSPYCRGNSGLHP